MRSRGAFCFGSQPYFRARPENGRARRFYEKYGLQPDGRERSRPHDLLPIEMHEIRYRMSLEPRMPQRRAPFNQ